jgi:hypothetical protein
MMAQMMYEDCLKGESNEVIMTIGSVLTLEHVGHHST